MSEKILIVVLVILVIVSSVQAFQLNSMSNRITGAAVSSGGSIDMTGWTENEKMNYEMHGIIPAKPQQGQQQTPTQPQMVGGC